MRRNFFSYLRVSTDKQGEQGYGIAAQRQAVTGYLNGGSWELLGEFVRRLLTGIYKDFLAGGEVEIFPSRG
jgi:DNA invertase Pin-like site-specific DNA recombinase